MKSYDCTFFSFDFPNLFSKNEHTTKVRFTLQASKAAKRNGNIKHLWISKGDSFLGKFLVLHFILSVDYAMDYVNPNTDYADHSLKPDYAEMTCQKPDNSNHQNLPINVNYTHLHLQFVRC